MGEAVALEAALEELGDGGLAWEIGEQAQAFTSGNAVVWV